ncbi:MAG: hypothetical protein HC855_13300 [Rhizobiales bacterium]|nr:hypothetical protein [Hyphomicrobiales bacterium]
MVRLIDKTPAVSRRTVLKTGGGAAAVAVAGPVVALAPPAYANAPVALTAEAFAALVKMARDLYPHDRIADTAYAAVISAHDAAAKDDAAKKEMLEKARSFSMA